MKIYFAASVTNNISNIDLYSKVIKYLTHYGVVLNKKIANRNFLKERQKNNFSKKEAHDFDLKLLLESDVVVAEITRPSLGVGYEIGRAIERKKLVLALYNKKTNKKLSPMIAGSSRIISHPYKTFTDIKRIINSFFNTLNP